jgi:hypothetical protein
MITIFSTCKPFSPQAGFRQENAITSWVHLESDPMPEIVLVGQEQGVAEIAQELEICHIPEVEQTDYGCPYVGSLFQVAEECAEFDVMVYINADIIVFEDFLEGVARVKEELDEFLMIGRRWNWSRPVEIDFSTNWKKRLKRTAQANGNLFVAATDYFVYTKGVFDIEFPKLVVGKCYWDMWLIWKALKKGVAVVDATDGVFVIHQNHKVAYNHDHVMNNYRLCKKASHKAKVNVGSAGWVLDGDGLREKKK